MSFVIKRIKHITLASSTYFKTR